MDVVYVLLDEADRQLQDPYGARFYNKVKLEDIVSDDISTATMSTGRETDSAVSHGEIHCTMVKNEFGETPLFTAVKSRRGWRMIEAIMRGPGGRNAAVVQDADKNTALHLLLSEYQDPVAAMSILKVAPEVAAMRNNAGILPIEVRYIRMMFGITMVLSFFALITCPRV